MCFACGHAKMASSAMLCHGVAPKILRKWRESLGRRI
jgi:hypothetical protein